MPLKPPVRYTSDIETTDMTERDTVHDLNEAFDGILKRTSADYGKAVRAVHAKAHAVLEGEMTIDPALPPEFAQGLFATPGTHKVYLRLSTNAGDILPDTISLPRGLALKVLDVEGERLIGAEGTTQDFIMVNGPVFQARDAKAFLGGLKLLASTTDRLEGTKEIVSSALRGLNTALEAVGIDSLTVKALGGAPNVEPLGETYFSVTPFRFGDYIAKFSLAPIAPEMTALTGKTIDVEGRDDAVREDLRTEMLAIDAAWEFRVQLCRDPEAQPIEDPTVVWDEEKAPFRRIAIIRVPHQDSWAGARVRDIDEGLRFSVWTGLAAHRPLGNINRARRETYRHSADFRAAFNRCPMHEPGE